MLRFFEEESPRKLNRLILKHTKTSDIIANIPHEKPDPLQELIAKEVQTTKINSLYKRLSPKEKEIFALKIKGKTNKEILDELAISRNQLNVHRSRINKKIKNSNL